MGRSASAHMGGDEERSVRQRQRKGGLVSYYGDNDGWNIGVYASARAFLFAWSCSGAATILTS